MTSHPKDCTEELLDAMRDCDKVCKYLHLPVQSGSSEVLSRMNRRYTAEQYLALTEKAKEKMPEIQISSDIIVGFPGETRDDFSKTLELIRTVEYYSLFTFIYSPRTGTPAAEMNDPISRKEKGDWFS
ncbi:MAG: radical SAM protein, partial [Oscillospiraceae bacterium]